MTMHDALEEKTVKVDAHLAMHQLIFLPTRKS